MFFWGGGGGGVLLLFCFFVVFFIVVFSVGGVGGEAGRERRGKGDGTTDMTVMMCPCSASCPNLRLSPHLSADSVRVDIGANVSFQCISGFHLVGASSVVCLPTGNWSASVPVCVTGGKITSAGIMLIFSGADKNVHV